jgi:opacity protein-like surface antigen
MKKLALLLLSAWCAPAWAQYGELWVSAGQNIFSNKGLGTLATIGGSQDDVSLNNGFRFGFRMGFNGDGRTGHEFQYAYNRTQLQFGTGAAATKQGMAVHMAGYNYLLYANREGARVRPFATGGVGFANFVPPGSSAAQGGGSTKYGFNYGGGVKLRVAGPYAVRFDVRQYTTPKPFGLPLAQGWIRINEISAGFGVVF